MVPGLGNSGLNASWLSQYAFVLDKGLVVSESIQAPPAVMNVLIPSLPSQQPLKVRDQAVMVCGVIRYEQKVNNGFSFTVL